jgi:hypothetical protein
LSSLDQLRPRGIGCCGLVADLLSVPIRVQAHRVREHAGRVHDIVGESAARRIEAGEIADPFRDLVIGGRRVAAHAEAADDAPVVIERQPAAEKDQAARDVTAIAIRLAWRIQEAGIEQVRLAEAGLGERVEARGREREFIDGAARRFYRGGKGSSET